MTTNKTSTRSTIKNSVPELKYRSPEECPTEFLSLDLNNPRLCTGDSMESGTELEVIQALSDIAALDELVTSICANTYLHLEPLIVFRPKLATSANYTVLEGNRRLAAIRLIQDPPLAMKVGIKLPANIESCVLDSIKSALVFRVEEIEDAREFIGFKHINGPQRWDAYAKARYVTDWYVSSNGKMSVSEIASRMGDNNNTLRAYIYATLILDQAERTETWRLTDRPSTKGRFAFSHLYTAIGRDEYQKFLGLDQGWSDQPPISPIPQSKLPELAEVLSYLYGNKSDDRLSLIKSQNPDLRDIGLAISNADARLTLKNRGTLDDARDAMKSPAVAFLDAVISVNIKLKRTIDLLPKYLGGEKRVDEIIAEIVDQAEILQTLVKKKSQRRLDNNA